MKSVGKTRKYRFSPKTDFEKRLFERFEEHARLEEERRKKIKKYPKPINGK